MLLWIDDHHRLEWIMTTRTSSPGDLNKEQIKSVSGIRKTGRSQADLTSSVRIL